VSVDAPDLRRIGPRLDALVAEVEAIADPRSRARARELVAVLLEVHGAGLARVLELVAETVADPGALFSRLSADELVAGLLVLHGLLPEPGPEPEPAGPAPAAATARAAGVPVRLRRGPR